MFFCAVVAASLFPEAGAQTQTATMALSPQDTYLKLDSSVNSTQTQLNLYTWPDYQAANAILMKFNMASLPAGATVQRAVLRLSLIQADTRAADYTVTAHKVIGRNPNVAQATGLTASSGVAWSPSGCCYGAPLAQSDISGPYATVNVGRTTGAYSWTITDLVREWLADPATNFGLLLNSDATKVKDAFRFFASMEHANTELRPVLEVTYSAGDATPPAVSVTSPIGGASLSGTATLTATASDQSGVAGVQFLLDGRPIGTEMTAAPYSMNWNTSGAAEGPHVLTARARDNANNTGTSAGVNVTVSNGALVLSPADTTLQLNATNYSQATTLATYTWPDRTIANAIVLKFAIPALPAGAVIQSATLQMSLVESDRSPEPTYTISAHKIVNRNVNVAAATGYTFNGSSNWTPSSCCYSSVPLAQSDISTPYDQPAIDKSTGVKSWNLTNMVQEWVANPASNFGVLLNSDASKPRDRYRYFASMEHANASLRPTLRIQYSGGSGTTDPPTNPPTDPPTNPPTNPPTDPPPTPLPTPDTTLPAVSLTAPANGASVSGASVQVNATASDNVGVAGVQFRLDGANLGNEDTSSPYSTTWNTTTASNGTHTLSAVARDAAGNQRTSSVTVTVSNTVTPPQTGGGGIATRYPGDVGIQNDPSVIFVENFEESSMSEIFNRWGDVRNGSSMTRTSDVPAGSPGSRSLTIPWQGGGVSSGGHLYKVLNPAINDVLYVRYYIKYPSVGRFHHTGIWMGGNNPTSAWPDPGAGSRPNGSDKFIAAAEQNTVTYRFDHYNYYYNMHADGGGTFWGNMLLNNPAIQAGANQWVCVEHMVRLNNPVSANNGEHAIWLNGTRVSHLGQGFPTGSWSGGIFTQGAGSTPFEGFRWRTSTALNLNWIWLQNYSPDDPAGVSSRIMFDHVVVARDYIGCLR